MKKLHKVFRNMDENSDGIVNVGDILSALDIERTRFTERIFAVFDAKQNGEIDFHEFVLSLWNYCTLGKGSLNYFTFDLYDWDESGDLSTDQIHGMISDFFGEDHDANPQARAMTDELNKISASVQQKGPIDLETFKSFTKFHQAVVYLTFNVQMKLRNTILGDEFWEELCKRRIKLSKGRSYMNINTIMTLHVGEQLVQRALQDSEVYLRTLRPRSLSEGGERVVGGGGGRAGGQGAVGVMARSPKSRTASLPSPRPASQLARGQNEGVEDGAEEGGSACIKREVEPPPDV